MDELETKFKAIEIWLESNEYHPRFEEGFNKLRELLSEMSKIYLEQQKPVAQRLF